MKYNSKTVLFLYRLLPGVGGFVTRRHDGVDEHDGQQEGDGDADDQAQTEFHHRDSAADEKIL